MPDLDELLTAEPSRAAADHVHPPQLAGLRERGARRRRTRRGAYAAGVAVMVAAVAIGAAVLPGDRSTPEPAPPTRSDPLIDLADRVFAYGDYPDVIVVDFAAARTALGLPDDAFPGPAIATGSSEEQQDVWKQFAGADLAVPQVYQSFSAVSEVIDPGQITAAGRTIVNGPGAITVLRTTQDFDMIADRLEEESYERDGDLLTFVGPQSSIRTMYKYVAGANGLLAIAGNVEDGAQRVRAAVAAAPPDPTEEGDLLSRIHAETGAPGLFINQPTSGDCVDAIVGVDRAGGEDEFLLVGDDPGALDLGLPDHLLGTPVRDGDLLRVPFEKASWQGGSVGPLAVLSSDHGWQCG